MESKNKILIADDERLNLLALNKILSGEYSLLMAKTGSEALESAAANRPDLMLLDIIMPDMDGFEVIKRLKADPELKNIPVIFITGLTNEQDEEKGLALGAVDYITKPFSGSIVRARVRTHMKIVRQIQLIDRLSRYDPLTEIPNRRHFNERAAIEWSRAIRERQPISFLMLDLDKFKRYNDTYGHPQGDELLKGAAKIIANCAKRSTDLVARLGGEEFGVLLPNTEREQALSVAERIRSMIEELRVPLIDGSGDTHITASIGMATHKPVVGDNYERFIAEADDYLYRAKDNGRNRVMYKGGEL